MKYLVDVNVWFALAEPYHAHHAEAAAWFEAASVGEALLSRVTMLGLLRLLTNATTMNGRPLGGVDAWQLYTRLELDERTGFLAEPDGVEEMMMSLLPRAPLSGAGWTDCYLASLALVSSVPILTFDQGFRRFHDLEVRLLGQ